jgi:hypothetical protein
MTVHLPGGRARRIGPDAIVGQNEAFENRADQIPKFKRWGWGTSGDLSTMLSHSVGALGAANTTYFALLPQLTNRVAVKYIRTRVTTNSAGNFLRVALYHLDADHIFRKLAATDGSFPTDSTGIQTLTLQREIELSPTDGLFLGFNVTSVTPNFDTLPSNVTSLLPCLSRAETITTMPTQAARTTLVNSGTATRIPLVAYLSTEAYQLF